jgi:hypothetical protein
MKINGANQVKSDIKFITELKVMEIPDYLDLCKVYRKRLNLEIKKLDKELYDIKAGKPVTKSRIIENISSIQNNIKLQKSRGLGFKHLIEKYNLTKNQIPETIRKSLDSGGSVQYPKYNVKIKNLTKLQKELDETLKDLELLESAFIAFKDNDLIANSVILEPSTDFEDQLKGLDKLLKMNQIQQTL